MKTFLTCIIFLTTTFFVFKTTPVSAQGEGTKVGDKIEKYIDNMKTSSSEQEKVQKELKDAIKKAKEANPDNAEKVKEDFYEAAKKIREKYKKNKETHEWIKEFLTKLLDNDLVELPNLNDLEKLATVKATGTGRTTGHIATLSVHNNSDKPIDAQIGPFFIPSGGQYQPYIVPRKSLVNVQPGQTATVPIEGYCADIHRLPVPAGNAMPPISEWIVLAPNEGIKHNWAPSTDKGWTSLPSTGNTKATDSRPQLLVPGTDKPLTHTIDINKYPTEAAPVLLEAINQISESYDKMAKKGAINTPFSGNPEKERESVIQQTFWIYTAALTGTVYKLSDFEKKTHEQFEKSTGNKVSGLKTEQKKELDKGVNDFWNTFQAVGAEAKVILLNDYKEVKKIDDFDNWARKKYDEYCVERAINNKSHEKACEAIGIKSDGDLADAFKRVYKAQGGK
ncbi:MAG: hypothetical protein M9959_14365 [Chitinophagaceae bacterium]|jgi:hypothetical protein|nr:hypothetical protein [Chitinophagaceae bacterium]